MVAGAEALAVGSLVLLAGTILIVNAWAVIDTRSALEGAAREYLRAYTEADDPQTAASEGQRALEMVLADRPDLRARTGVQVPSPELFGPCAPAGVDLSATVPAVRIPLLDAQWGDHTVRVSAVELIDAHQEMLAGKAFDFGETACGG